MDLSTTEHLDRIEDFITDDPLKSHNAPTRKQSLESLRAIRQQFEETEKANAGSPAPSPDSSPDTHKSGVGITPLGDVDPFFCVWRCSCCGEMNDTSLRDSRWRWNGEAWEHACGGTQEGHYPARNFGPHMEDRSIAMAQQPHEPDTDSPDARTQVEGLIRRLEVLARTTLHATVEGSSRSIERDDVRHAAVLLRRLVASEGRIAVLTRKGDIYLHDVMEALQAKSILSNQVKARDAQIAELERQRDEAFGK